LIVPSEESSRPILNSFKIGSFGWLEKHNETGSVHILDILDEKTALAKRGDEEFILRGFDFSKVNPNRRIRIDTPLVVAGNKKYDKENLPLLEPYFYSNKRRIKQDR
jgi:hypothetical protein